MELKCTLAHLWGAQFKTSDGTAYTVRKDGILELDNEQHANELLASGGAWRRPPPPAPPSKPATVLSGLFNGAPVTTKPAPRAKSAPPASAPAPTAAESAPAPAAAEPTIVIATEMPQPPAPTPAVQVPEAPIVVDVMGIDLASSQSAIDELNAPVEQVVVAKSLPAPSEVQPPQARGAPPPVSARAKEIARQARPIVQQASAADKRAALLEAREEQLKVQGEQQAKLDPLWRR